MKISHYSTIKPTAFDNDVARGVKGRVLIGKNDGAVNFCMRLFELIPGGHTPKHSHAWEHEIFVHSGTGSVLQNGKWIPVEAGSAVFIPGEEEHQLKNTGDTPFQFVCLIPGGPPEL